jgi:pilus assembly protein CpaE
MRFPGNSAPDRLRVVALVSDAEFEPLVRAAFAGQAQMELQLARWDRVANASAVDRDAACVVVDLDATRRDDVKALARLAAAVAGRVPIVVVTSLFNESVARQLMQSRIADFLIKPVAAGDLGRACARVIQEAAGTHHAEAHIHTFLPAAGGVGVTTLAIQTALLLLNSGARGSSTTCLVDLDFQHGACADYLDLEPRLDLNEIEPRPERLDAQLLEVMLSHHSSGLAVVAAPNRPAEMRSFDAQVVTRLLDLVAARFDHVVIDMPRTWFTWTDGVLLGSNASFIVTEMTVPGLRHAKQLIAAIAERLAEAAPPRVIVNRFEQRWFAPGLRRADIRQTLGEAFAGTIPNDYRLVREAIDRGVPLEDVRSRNGVVAELKKLVLPPVSAARQTAPATAEQPRRFAWAR